MALVLRVVVMWLATTTMTTAVATKTKGGDLLDKYEQVGDGGACRLDDAGKDNGKKNVDYVVRSFAEIEQCQKACDADAACVAMEFSGRSGRCELWRKLPLSAQKKDRISCYAKKKR